MSLIIKEYLLSKPDTKLYEHLSEKERMVAGFPYNEFEEELQADRIRARNLTAKYNLLDDDNETDRRELLDIFLSPMCRGKKISIESNFSGTYGYNTVIGNNVRIKFDCLFMDCASITIGDNCLISVGVHIYTAQHPLDPKHRKDNTDYYELAFPIKIGNNCCIGGKTTICSGVTIGDNVTIGPGSVVIKDIPSNSFAAGSPAKVIK